MVLIFISGDSARGKARLLDEASADLALLTVDGMYCAVPEFFVSRSSAVAGLAEDGAAYLLCRADERGLLPEKDAGCFDEEEEFWSRFMRVPKAAWLFGGSLLIFVPTGSWGSFDLSVLDLDKDEFPWRTAFGLDDMMIYVDRELDLPLGCI